MVFLTDFLIMTNQTWQTINTETGGSGQISSSQQHDVLLINYIIIELHIESEVLQLSGESLTYPNLIFICLCVTLTSDCSQTFTPLRFTAGLTKTQKNLQLLSGATESVISELIM